IDASTGVFTWTPSEAQGPGVYTFKVRVSDGTANTDADITITVNEVNLAPASGTNGGNGNGTSNGTPKGASPVHLFAGGADAGSAPQVKVYNADGSLRFNFLAFAAGFRGGIRVATGDVTGDGIDDIIVGAGPGAPGGHVKVFDGLTGAEIRS